MNHLKRLHDLDGEVVALLEREEPLILEINPKKIYIKVFGQSCGFEIMKPFNFTVLAEELWLRLKEKSL